MANVDEYEGTFCDLDEPGYHAIEKGEVEYIKVTRLEVIDKVLFCEYELLVSGFTDDEIEELVFVVLLKRFCRDYYVKRANFVRFIDSKSKNEWQILYLG